MSIDWQAAHDRLRQSQQALERALAPDPERLAAIYRTRAAQLASRRRSAEAPADAQRCLTFLLGTERYGLRFTDVAELLPFVRCTPVPGGSAALCGVMNLHGEVVSVLDLALLLELPDYTATPSGYVILLHRRDGPAALRVDQLDRVQLVSAAEIVAPADADGRVLSHYCQGIAAAGLRVLHTAAVLAHPLLHEVGS
jgi:chemotaxis signal transduction protein